MNDDKFVFGGLTNEHPKIFARIFDESGINTTGSGIGHDITAIIDENTTDQIILNDFYETELDDFTRGKLLYPLNNLKEGKHTLSLKAWDVYNNSGEAYTEFVVAKSAQLALDHILNYPNPFTTSTNFYFEHNQPGQGLEIRIQIFTVSGRVIQTLDHYTTSNSLRVGPIHWDGRDEFGDKIGRGVYIYKLSVKTPTGEKEEKFEKLVILN
jgi:hypothetical protein